MNRSYRKLVGVQTGMDRHVSCSGPTPAHRLLFMYLVESNEYIALLSMFVRYSLVGLCWLGAGGIRP